MKRPPKLSVITCPVDWLPKLVAQLDEAGIAYEDVTSMAVEARGEPAGNIRFISTRITATQAFLFAVMCGYEHLNATLDRVRLGGNRDALPIGERGAKYVKLGGAFIRDRRDEPTKKPKALPPASE
jgi:hypothetical protein